MPARVSAAGETAPICRRRVNRGDGDNPYRRAVAETHRGSLKLSAMIRRFSSSVRRRRAPVAIPARRGTFGIANADQRAIVESSRLSLIVHVSCVRLVRDFSRLGEAVVRLAVPIGLSR